MLIRNPMFGTCTARLVWFLLVFAASTFAIVLPAVAVTVDVAINGKFDSRYQVGGQDTGAVSSGYSLHAGARVRGVLPSLDVKHDPAQTGIRDTTFPVTLINTNQGAGKETTPTPGPTLSQVNAATRYATKPYFIKIFGVTIPISGDTGFAVASGVNAAGTAETDAQARETVAVSIPANNRYQVNTAGSEAKVIKTDPLRAPAGDAGRIMLDPWSFGPSFAGDDALIGGLTLTSDFNVTIDDPFGSAQAAFQAASNMQTTADPTFAPIGTSFGGLPLIYTLGFTFHPGSFATPDIGFGFNPSYEFFDPSDVTFSNPLSPGSLQSYVIDKITGALIPSGNSITLAGELPLFVYRGTSVADVADLQLDQLQGVLVSTAVPQPASGALLCIGLAVAGLVAVRRSRA